MTSVKPDNWVSYTTLISPTTMISVKPDNWVSYLSNHHDLCETRQLGQLYHTYLSNHHDLCETRQLGQLYHTYLSNHHPTAWHRKNSGSWPNTHIPTEYVHMCIKGNSTHTCIHSHTDTDTQTQTHTQTHTHIYHTHTHTHTYTHKHTHTQTHTHTHKHTHIRSPSPPHLTTLTRAVSGRDLDDVVVVWGVEGGGQVVQVSLLVKVGVGRGHVDRYRLRQHLLPRRHNQWQLVSSWCFVIIIIMILFL